MKNVKLLHQTESINKMLVYHYDVHAWRWDVKFWLIGGKWCTNLEGKTIVGELTESQMKFIQEYAPIIEQHEKENQNWLAFQNCKKRTCICKSCNRICNCFTCKEKIMECDKKNLKD